MSDANRKVYKGQYPIYNMENKKIEIEKLGSMATFYIEEDQSRCNNEGIAMLVHWDHPESPEREKKIRTISNVRDGKVFFKIGFTIGKRRCDGFSVDSETEEKLRKMFKKMREMREQKEEEEKQKFQNRIEEKKKKNIISLSWIQGSPLSGWVPSSDEDEKILEEIGLVEDISGWGTKVKSEVVEAKSFKRSDDGEKAEVSYSELKKKKDEIEDAKQKKNNEIDEIAKNVEIIEREKEDTAGFSGTKTKVKYEGKEYMVEIGGFDNSFGEGNVEDNWISVHRIIPEVSSEVEKAIFRRVKE